MDYPFSPEIPYAAWLQSTTLTTQHNLAFLTFVFPFTPTTLSFFVFPTPTPAAQIIQRLGSGYDWERNAVLDEERSPIPLYGPSQDGDHLPSQPPRDCLPS